MDKGKRFGGEKFADSLSLPFWSWNDKLEKERLLEQIAWIDKNKMGGFFMHARAGLKTEYLSDEWFECIRACCKKATELNLEPWAYDENGWPSGFVGGELLKDQENLENYLEYSFGDFDESALVVYDVQTEQLKRVFEKGKSNRYLNVYKRTTVSSVDVLDKTVVDKFIEHTHEKYKKKLGEDFKKIKGFFTDEPQFCRVATLYPHVIEKVYKERYGEDILDNLGLLFVEKKGYKTFRYRYWTVCQNLFLENFARNIYEWCDNNGVKLTGHYIEERDLYAQMLFNAGIMPFYEYEHIPGIDWLCKRFMSIVPVRQLTSVCAQLGKEYALTESYAMTGWDVTPLELKAITEFQYFYGVNKVCQHLMPYSEIGERKNDHPCHTSDINPWIREGLKDFNEYFNRLGGIIKGSEEFTNVAVLHPIRSAYFNFKHGDYKSTKELDTAFIELSNSLAKKGVGFNYVDETLLSKHGFINKDKIGCGRKEYDYLIIPKCYTMDKHTEELIKEYYKNGGKILFAFDKPTHLEGEEHDYSYIDSNVTLEEIIKAQPYKIQTYSEGVFSAYRKCGEFDCLFILNTDNDNPAEGKFTVNGRVLEYDILMDEEKLSSTQFRLKALESKIYIIENKERPTQYKAKEKQEITLPCGGFKVESSDDNALVLDYAEVSFDGKTYGEKQWVAGIFNTLLSNRYEGDLYLKFKFNTRFKPQRAMLMSEFEKAIVTVNGNEVYFDDVYYADPKMKLGNIAPFIKIGDNEVIVKLYFYENPKVYYALFGKNVTESLRNCLVYDTYIESLRLFGDFGVFTDTPMQYSRTKDVLFAADFYLDNKKDVIDEMVKDGYPFFSGKITLSKTIYLDHNNVNLKLNGRLHFARVYVNGNFVSKVMFDSSVDISKYAVIGENKITVELYTSVRNLLGPHHDARFDEIGHVTPFFFSMSNTWKDGKSLLERKSYSLVRTGIFNPNIKDWYHI